MRWVLLRMPCRPGCDKFVSGRRPVAAGLNQEAGRLGQGYRVSDDDLVVFEPVDGRCGLVGGELGSFCQRLLADPALFEFGAIVAQPVGDSSGVFLDFSLITVCHCNSSQSRAARANGRADEVTGFRPSSIPDQEHIIGPLAYVRAPWIKHFSFVPECVSVLS